MPVPTTSKNTLTLDGQKGFILPPVDALYTPFFNRPSPYYPDSDAQDLQCAEWIDAALQQRSTGRIIALRNIRAFTWAAASFPTCQDKTRLRLVADFFLFSIYLDDVTDKLTERELLVLVDGMQSQQRPEGEQPDIEGIDDPTGLIKLTRDLWSRFRKHANGSFQRHMQRHLDEFLTSLVAQAGNRDKTAILDLPTQMLARRGEAGPAMYITLIECAYNIEVPDFVLAHPVIVAITNAAGDLINWTNDIHSYNRERASGNDNSNLITTLLFNYGKSLQEAVDFVAELCRSSGIMIRQKFDEILTVRFDETGVDEIVAIYVAGIREMLRGSVQWTYLIDRYHGQEGEKMKDGGVVKLSPRKC